MKRKHFKYDLTRKGEGHRFIFDSRQVRWHKR